MIRILVEIYAAALPLMQLQSMTLIRASNATVPLLITLLAALLLCKLLEFLYNLVVTMMIPGFSLFK